MSAFLNGCGCLLYVGGIFALFFILGIIVMLISPTY